MSTVLLAEAPAWVVAAVLAEVVQVVKVLELQPQRCFAMINNQHCATCCALVLTSMTLNQLFQLPNRLMVLVAV